MCSSAFRYLLRTSVGTGLLLPLQRACTFRRCGWEGGLGTGSKRPGCTHAQGDGCLGLGGIQNHPVEKLGKGHRNLLPSQNTAWEGQQQGLGFVTPPWKRYVQREGHLHRRVKEEANSCGLKGGPRERRERKDMGAVLSITT